MGNLSHLLFVNFFKHKFSLSINRCNNNVSITARGARYAVLLLGQDSVTFEIFCIFFLLKFKMSNATSENDNHVESKEQSIDEPKNLEESVNDEDWETGSEGLDCFSCLVN